MLCYRVLPADGIDLHTTLSKLRMLQEEEPSLRVSWNDARQEILVHLMGEVQLEILTRLFCDRFGISLTFDEGSIAYKETIADTVEGIGHFEPLRHYAEVRLILSPGERGSGVRFSSICPEEVLARNWQNLIFTHLAEKEHLGVLTGSPVTDIVFTLASGKSHLKHTEGGDFRQATYRAVRQGLMQAKSIVLEPGIPFGWSFQAKTSDAPCPTCSAWARPFLLPKSPAAKPSSPALHPFLPCAVIRWTYGLYTRRGTHFLHAGRLPPLPRCRKRDSGNRL